MSEGKCWSCETAEVDPGNEQHLCAKCEEGMRTCAFCGKVHASREAPGFDFYGVPYCKACVAGRIPESYGVQDGCYNCAEAFCFSEYDDGNTYYCTHGAPPRPRSGSVLLGEYHSMGFSEEEQDRNMREWDKWSLGREVKPWGKCGHWRRRDEPQENA